ncbi:hypothetical protein F5882DRAFT_322178, partial [Hyaloscypha sp. PMI_1271]
MTFLSTLRNPPALLATFSGLVGSTYLLRSHMIELSEAHEARNLCHDELEGTFRGYTSLIEEALNRLEGKATEVDQGKKIRKYKYGKRQRDEK